MARIGKTVTDGDLATKLHQRLGWLAEDRVATVFAFLAAIVEASPLSAAQRLQVWEAPYDGLKRIADGQHPFRFRMVSGVVSVTGCRLRLRGSRRWLRVCRGVLTLSLTLTCWRKMYRLMVRCCGGGCDVWGGR